MDKITLLKCCSTDLDVVNAARVSFDKESNEMNENDIKLLKYLAKNGHTSPFFHPQIQFRIKMPLFVAREWYRHQVGLCRNEVSRRYVDYEPEVWIPSIVRERNPSLKQGSLKTAVKNNDEVLEMIQSTVNKSIETYNELIKQNVAPELARIILPQSTYTEFIETGSLYAYANLCKARMHPSAQLEIQEYAKYINDVLSEKFPHSWNVLMEFSYNK
jgi:thymidylate synthase (FAD)